MAFDVRPADVFDDVRQVIGPKRADANVCWCLSYRIPSRLNRELRCPERGEFVAELCRRDPPPDVLAYDDGTPVGWAGIAPRADLNSLARTNSKIPHVDDLPVWTMWCFRTRAGNRGRGIAHALLAGAVDFARSYGASAIEGYPVDNRGKRVDLTMGYVGTRALFERAGFAKAAEERAVGAEERPQESDHGFGRGSFNQRRHRTGILTDSPGPVAPGIIRGNPRCSVWICPEVGVGYRENSRNRTFGPDVTGAMRSAWVASDLFG